MTDAADVLARLDPRDAVEVPLGELTLYPGNAKQHDLPTIRRSLRRFGQYRPAVVQKATGHVLIGNGMVEAMTAEGWDHAAVLYADIDNDAARALVLLDNRVPELGGYDVEALIELLQQAPTLDGTGYDTDFLTDLQASIAVPTFAEEDPDAQPRLDEKNPLECPNCHHRWVP